MQRQKFIPFVSGSQLPGRWQLQRKRRGQSMNCWLSRGAEPELRAAMRVRALPESPKGESHAAKVR